MNLQDRRNQILTRWTRINEVIRSKSREHQSIHLAHTVGLASLALERVLLAEVASVGVLVARVSTVAAHVPKSELVEDL